MHDPLRHIAIVGQEQQTFRFPIEAAHREDTFRNPDQVHHCPAVTFVTGRGDVSGRLVQHQIAQGLLPDDLAIDPNLVALRIGLCAELDDDRAINSTRPSRIICSAARRDATPRAAKIRCRRSKLDSRRRY